MGRIDLATFSATTADAKDTHPERALRVGQRLVDGALRIRRGGDGVYADIARPAVKPAEAIGAWLGAMEEEIRNGTFQRPAELREALIAIGEEVDTAARQVPSASRLRDALYSDAIEHIGARPSTLMTWLPWALGGLCGGVLLGHVVKKRYRR